MSNETLWDGQDPPDHKINPDYKKQPSNPREYEQCGKTHDTVAEDMRTGERIKEINNCMDCLYFGLFIPKLPSPLITEWGGEKIKVKTSKKGWVDLVDELNMLEKMVND